MPSLSSSTSWVPHLRVLGSLLTKEREETEYLWILQPQTAPNPSSHDSDDPKIVRPYPTSSQYPASFIRGERSISSHSPIDGQCAPSFISFDILDPHQPKASPHPAQVYPPPATVDNPPRHIKYFISIDFGAAYSGVSYVTPGSGEVHAWTGSSGSLSKIPTCLVYDALGHIRAWGLEAKDISLKKGWIRCEWFKLWLNPSSAPRTVLASRIFQPPKNVVDVVADYLSCLWMHTKSLIQEKHPSSFSHAEVYLTVPSSWDLQTSLLLREAATKAGLVVQDSESEDIYWEERLHIIPEAEASVIHSFLSPAFKFPQDQVLTICDAGGATVDLATYKVLRASGAPKIAEDRSTFWFLLRILVFGVAFSRARAGASRCSPRTSGRSQPGALSCVAFSQSEKLDYKGAEDDTKQFRFRCLHGEDWGEAPLSLVMIPPPGLDHGELIIPGDVLRREVFDPVVKEVLHSIATHVQASHVRPDVLLLVGGFSANGYLFQCISDQFSPSILSIIRPADGDIALCRGGARFGIGSPVSSVIQPQNVFRLVSLPVQEEDRMTRPAYITNVAGRWFCERRVEYIIRRGASLMKGSRRELRVRKFCASRYDRTLDSCFTRRLVTKPGDTSMKRSFLEQVEASPFGISTLISSLGLRWMVRSFDVYSFTMG
ncbi:hypothetical protein BS47DRAFT_1487511 [Hydnum rufescens UP504]|uniref:Actin-like ATPase domain-containing protein n=1 Tax=Hydnum rufescens UP504 TaxID=1448309 RepID=A0A9P6ARF0_9AGAM|nr:hypothetical protein BS47DRAFT_1487511 [Hydnum rufescens UP504]